MSCTTEANERGDCGCNDAQSPSVAKPGRVPPSLTEPNLGDLIPIAVVVTAGCRPCAERMVKRALAQGSPKQHIRKVLALVAHMQALDCLAEKVGPDVTARMQGPLAAAKKTLDTAQA